jgi:cell division protein FtsL
MARVVEASIETRNPRGIGVGAFLLALVTAGAMAHVGVRMKGIEVAYELGREKRVNKQLEEERRRLNIEIGMLKDPVRVVTFARDTLKMGPPAPTAIVRLVPGQILGAKPAVASERASGLRPQASGRIRTPRPEVRGPKPSSEAPRSEVRGPKPPSKPAADGPPTADDAPAQEGE